MSYEVSITVKGLLDQVATAAASAFVADRRGWEPVSKLFAEACSAADLETVEVEVNGKKVEVINWESVGAKAVIAYISPKVVTALAADSYYDIPVHRVGADDEYLPVDADHPANYTIQGSFAVSANLNDLASVKDKPRGLKAWLRGGANGLRPDSAAQGLRDLINNNKDQVISRLKKREDARRSASSKKDLEAKLLELYKHLKGSRDRYENNGGVCMTDSELKAWALRAADEVLKRSPAKGKKS